MFDKNKTKINFKKTFSIKTLKYFKYKLYNSYEKKMKKYIFKEIMRILIFFTFIRKEMADK